MGNCVILAESQLIGGHTEYYVLCGLGVPSLRSLWGAVRNRQLYILRMYCKGCISFIFQFFLRFTRLTAKKNITRIYRKKKLHDETIFLYTTYIFHSNPPGPPTHSARAPIRNPRHRAGVASPRTGAHQAPLHPPPNAGQRWYTRRAASGPCPATQIVTSLGTSLCAVEQGKQGLRIFLLVDSSWPPP